MQPKAPEMPPSIDEKQAARLKSLAREIREEMGDANVLDALVRELAISRLALSDLQLRLDDMAREMATVKAVQQARDILLPHARVQYAGRRQAQLDASLPMPANRGFHGLERDGSGNPFRWTGPTPTFHFDFHLDRSSPVKLLLQLASWGAEQARGLRCFCDNVEVLLVRRSAVRTVDFEGLLLPREVLGVSRISFIVETMSSAPAQGGELAVRQIGVPFLKLVASAVNDDEAGEWLKKLELPAPLTAAAPAAKTGPGSAASIGAAATPAAAAPAPATPKPAPPAAPAPAPATAATK